MANSMFIKPKVYTELSEGQIYEWRKDTYENLGTKRNFTKDELKALDNIQLPTLSELLDEISDQIKEAKILGKLKYRKDTLIYIDSSSMCQLTIPIMIRKIILKHPEIKKSNLILVFSNISKVENLYKFVNNYPGVKYNKLSFNMDLLMGKIPFKMKNVFILTTNLALDNKLLIDEEQEYLNIFKTWKNINVKNEINDNAQIKLMVELLGYFNNKQGIILSHDKMMCGKVKDFMIDVPNLHIFESVDFKQYHD